MNLYTHISALIIGAVIAFLCLRGCEEKPQTVTTTKIEEKIIFIHDTVFQGEGKGVLRYTYGGMVHDTILERVVITTERGDTIKEFTATLDTIQHGDTLHVCSVVMIYE